MRRRMRRLLALLLLSVLLFCPVATVFAEEPSRESGGRPASDGGSGSGIRDLILKNADAVREQIVRYALASLHYVIDVTEIDAFINFVLETGEIELSDQDMLDMVDDSGVMTVPAGVISQINVQLNSYMSQEHGYYIEPACPHPPSWVHSHLKYYSPATVFSSEFSDIINSNDFVDFFPSGLVNASSIAIVYPGAEEYFLVKRGGTFSFYSASLEDVSCSYVCYYYNGLVRYDFYYYNNAYGSNSARVEGPVSEALTWYHYFKKDTMIFSGTDALNNYLFGERLIYNVDGIGSRIADLSLSVNALNADYKKYNQETLAAILAAIEESRRELDVDTLSEEQLQAVVDSVVGSRFESLQQAIEKGNEENSQQNVLIYEKLCQIFELLSEWYNDDISGELGGGTGSAPSSFDFDSLFAVDSILNDAPDNILQQMLQIPDRILSGLGSVLDDSLESFFKNHLEPLLRELIVPDEETVSASVDNLKANIPFIGILTEFSSYFASQLYEYESPPVIYFAGGILPCVDEASVYYARAASGDHESGGRPASDDRESGGRPAPDGGYAGQGIVASHLGGVTFEFDFTWYEPYRASMRSVISGFLWLGFYFRLFRKLPRIIGGEAEL